MNQGNQADPVLKVSNLSIDIGRHNDSPRRVVDDVSFSIAPGEVVALVGESGSGKTLTGGAMMHLLPPAAKVSQGTIEFTGSRLSAVNDKAMRQLRGREIGMVFQEPMVSLNPALKIGSQMIEAIKLHEAVPYSEARRRCIAMLEKVQLPRPEASLNAYPHEFSGGMRQRIMLASALVMRPKLLIADEPTTALDALICKEVMDLMIALTREIGTAVLLISHDLGMVAEYADLALVMRDGKVVDSGDTSSVLLNPRHPYTQDLMRALPSRGSNIEKKSREPLISVKDLSVVFKSGRIWLRKQPNVQAVNQVSLSIGKGETLAIVGESGSGKTTIGQTLLGLQKKTAGTIFFNGHDVSSLSSKALADFRSKTQIVFQDPFTSLDPRMTLGQTVAEGLRHINGLSRAERLKRTRDIFEEVGLSRDYLDRFPHELSGGQRQRVSIARSIVANPMFIVADEPVSALDVTVQRQVMQLLSSLQEKYGFSCLLVSHDLAVVEQMADRVAVIYRGRLLEVGPRDAIYDNPRHPYTIRLLEATPRIVPNSDGSYTLVRRPKTRVSAPRGAAYFNHGSIPDTPLSQNTARMIEISSGHFVCCTHESLSGD